MEFGFEELWDRLIGGDESVMVEAKAASEIGPSILETISSFSNETGRKGGYLLLGVSRVEDSLFPTYEILGVPDSDKTQSDIATQCRTSFNALVRPEMIVHASSGRSVVVVFIPEAQPQDKPVFIQSKGLPRGAFRRIGPTDQHCTDDDIQYLYQERSHNSFDESIITDADLSDFDANAIAEYRKSREKDNPDAPELRYDDTDLLHCLKCVSRHDGQLKPTIAGLILFGSPASIRRQFPMMRVDYIRINGKEWVRHPEARFESLDILGPLMLAIPRAINSILDDLPKAFRLVADENQRTDVPLIPRTAIREAIVNAVMHRSYRLKSPVQIIRYSNRLEIRNPGHSLVPDDRLGEPGSTTRNEKIAAVLHETRYAETKGSGIRSMREAMANANLTPPFFESDRERDSFVVTFLFHHFLSAGDVEWLGSFSALDLNSDEQKALVFVREMGAINNWAYRDINRVDTLAASGHLRRLRDLKLLEQKGKGASTYYEPTKFLLSPPLPPEATPETTVLSQGLTPQIRPDAVESARSDRLNSLPAELRDMINNLGQRSPGARPMRAAIRAICEFRPSGAREIAALLGRDFTYIRVQYLGPMVQVGELEYTHPDTPSHPNTKYRVPKSKPD